MVTYQDARHVAGYLAKTINPLCVVLFGSVAKEGQGEDLDLLIVVEDQVADSQDVHTFVQDSLKPYAERYAIDPFILSQSALRRYFLDGSPFLRLIQREGRCFIHEGRYSAVVCPSEGRIVDG